MGSSCGIVKLCPNDRSHILISEREEGNLSALTEGKEKVFPVAKGGRGDLLTPYVDLFPPGKEKEWMISIKRKKKRRCF